MVLAPAFFAVTFVAPAPRAALVAPAFVPEALVPVDFVPVDFVPVDFWAVARFAGAFVADVRPDADVFFDVGPAEATPLVAPPRAGDLPVLSATVALHRLHVTRQAPVGACRWPNDRK
jgi:hypothetical protein